MASKFDSSFQNSSDLIHDFTCSPCEEDGLNSEAHSFCVDCSKYFCSRCEPKHGSLFKRHSVLGRKDVKKWAALPHTVVDDLERCEQHPREALRMFCKDHDQLCCHVCVSVDHRHCLVIEHIPDIAKGIYDQPEFKQLPQQVANIQSQIGKLQDSYKRKQQSIRESRAQVLQEIKALRKKIDEVLDQLERNTIKELDSMVALLQDVVETEVKQSERMSKDMKSIVDSIQAKGKTNESLAFVGNSKCQKMINETKSFLLETTKETLKLSFVPSSALNDLIDLCASLQVFGEVTNIPHVFTAVSIKQLNVSLSGEKEKCSIRGICELPSGEHVLADAAHNCVKLLNQAYQVVNKCNVPRCPQDLCHITKNELAVAVNYNDENRHEVCFFNVSNSKLQQTRTLAFSHTVRDLSHHSGRLYISTDTALFSYDIGGNDGRKLFENLTGTYTVYKCDVSAGGSKLYIANYGTSQLITLNCAGTKLATFADPDIIGPRAVHVSPLGHVFVCSYVSNSVLQLNSEGITKLAKLAAQSDGVKLPVSVCYSSRTSSLLVGQHDNNNVVVIKIK